MGQIIFPYWRSPEKWGAWALLVVLLCLSLISALLLVLVSIFLGEVTSALVALERDRFMQALLIFGGIIVLGVPLVSAKTYVQAKLSLYWRNWLTQKFLQTYLSDRQFYRIADDPHLDNPDQRIAEDVKIVTEQFLFLVVILFDAGLQLLAFAGVLWRISQPLMIFLMLYAVLGTGITTFLFGRVLVGINAEQLQREADFRFSLVRLRENAEAIAFYQGEAQESAQIGQRFLAVFSNFRQLIRWQLGLNFFQNGYQYLTFLLPALILAPAILAGQQEIGVEAQASTAFRVILLALALVIQQFEQLTALAASLNRLAQLDTAKQSENQAQPGLSCGDAHSIGDAHPVSDVQSTDERHPIDDHNSRITIQPAEKIALHQVTLYTPDRQTQLINQLSFALEPGQSLLLMGRSGVGKSSLLRAIAGLWQSGSGIIDRPPLSEILFLPQRPYLVLGTLRDQVCYPSAVNVSDADIWQILAQVNLAHLGDRFDLETILDWEKILSAGEQQRLSFARLLLIKPKFALLDEATSGLDVDNERLLYTTLKASAIAYLSVGHRSTLQAFHQSVLHLG